MPYFLQLHSNQILCQFVSMYPILTLALPPQYSDYENKVKRLVNIAMDILDLYCIRLSNASLFRKNYAQLYFVAKHLKGIE